MKHRDFFSSVITKMFAHNVTCNVAIRIILDIPHFKKWVFIFKVFGSSSMKMLIAEL